MKIMLIRADCRRAGEVFKKLRCEPARARQIVDRVLCACDICTSML